MTEIKKRECGTVVKIVANADDFGYSHETNMAIANGFAEGYITNTSIMANMPAREEAVSIAFNCGFADKVGLHFNIMEGVPLTEEMKRSTFFTKDGVFSGFSLPPIKRALPEGFSSAEQRALALEADAQMCWFRDAGFTSPKFDSHRAIHSHFSVMSVISEILTGLHFSEVRPRPIYPGRINLEKIYSTIFNYKYASPYVFLMDFGS